jgi:prevent-host-death family protein
VPNKIFDSRLRWAIWETFIFAQLRDRERRAGRAGGLFFWRDRTREVDFVVDAGGRLELFEAKWTELPDAGDTVNLEFVRNAVGKSKVSGGADMIDITNDIQSLTTFRRSSGDFMKQLKKTKRPVVLTVNGKAAAVVQDAGAYQRLLDVAARADAEEGIRQRLDDVARGRTRAAREVFDQIRRKHGIPG